MDLKGKLSIGVTTGREDDLDVRIEVMDADSHVNLIEVRLNKETFADAMFGRVQCDCLVTFFNQSNRVGTISENKTEMVPVPENRPYGNDSWIAKALAPFLKDGWKPRESDMKNHHCHVRNKEGTFQRVVFFRHVRKDGTPVLEEEAE